MPVSANFSGAKARSGKGGGTKLATGYYSAKTLSTDSTSKATSIMIQLELTEPGFEGIQRRTYPGTDMTKAGNVNTWYTAYVSHGFDGEALQTGEEVEIDETIFHDVDCFLYIKAADENVPNSKDSIEFVTPEAYLASKEEAVEEVAEEVVEAPPAKVVAKPAAKPAAAPAKPAAAPAKAVAPVKPPAPPAATGAGFKALLAKKQADAAAKAAAAQA